MHFRDNTNERGDESQLCDPVSSSAQAAQIAADVRREGSEGWLIIPDTSKPGLGPYRPLILPLKTGAHLGVHPHAVEVINTRHRNRLACDDHTHTHTRKTEAEIRSKVSDWILCNMCAFCQRSGFVHTWVRTLKRTHTKIPVHTNGLLK